MQKKILIFIPEFPTVTETFIAREVAGLVGSEKLDVTILAKKSGTGSLPENVKEKSVYTSVKIWDSLFSLRFLLMNPKGVFKALKLCGLNNFYHFGVGLSYAQLFKKYKPEFILAHFMSVHSTYAMVAATVLNIEYGISAHARDITEYPHLIKSKVKTAKFISICNKNAFEKVLEESEGLASSNVRLIYHGYDPKILELENPPHKDQIPLVLLMGRFVEKKGIEYAIEAAKILKDKNIEFKMKIVGKGVLEETIFNKIRKFGLEDHVELAGTLSHPDFVQLMYRASVYLQPSIVAKSGDVDGVPNGLIEASLIGVPCVTTDAGSISDLLTSDNAIIVEQRNSEQLSEAIEFLLKNPEKSFELVSKARAKATRLFSQESSISKLVDLIL